MLKRIPPFYGCYRRLPTDCRYLETLKPLLSAEDYNRTEQLVQSLLADEGPVLQNYLQTR